jgi:hypothetical protein
MRETLDWAIHPKSTRSYAHVIAVYPQTTGITKSLYTRSFRTFSIKASGDRTLMNTAMEARMYTVLLVDGCHYVSAEDANAIASAVREGCESVEITAHMSAIGNERRTARISLNKVLKLIAHDVPNVERRLHPVSISDFRSRRRGRSGSRIPFSTR